MKWHPSILTIYGLFLLLPCLTIAQTGKNTSGQIKHVEIVTFQPGTNDSIKHAVDKLYRKASEAFPNVSAYDWGWDLNDNKQNRSIYVTTVNSTGDITKYNASAQHQLATKSKAIKNITTIDYPVNK